MAASQSGLKHIDREVEELSKLLRGAKVCTGVDATLEAFGKYAPDSDIVHIASHALFRSDNPLYSGIRFENGWLLARDLYQMRLHCRLATLSACATGVSIVETGDEIFGLIRGFLTAGVRTVVGSLWSVEDSLTADLMVEFYSILTSGGSVGGAMRLAQIKMMKTNPHPYYWAGFMVVGDREFTRTCKENLQ